MIKDILNRPISDVMPQVTFALFAYNQEEFICEAVNSALAQDYKSLTIIISDDCSKDNTFELIKLMATTYTGPHQIILNRNEKNLGHQGFCAHVNKVFELIKSDLIIMAAGDDISFPERTSVLVNAWMAAGKPSGSLHSAVQTISNLPAKNNSVINGRASFDDLSIQQAIRIGVVGLLGCSHAVTRDIFTRFGRLPDSISFEDRALAFRSFLAGKIIYCDKILVQYRIQDDSLSGVGVFRDDEKWQKWLNNIIGLYKSFLVDCKLHDVSNLIPISAFEEIERAIRHAECSRMLVAGTPLERLKSVLHYTRQLNFPDRLAFIFKVFSWENGLTFKVMSLALKFLRNLRS